MLKKYKYKFLENMKRFLEKYPIFENYFSEIIPLIVFFILYFSKIINIKSSVNIDYIGYAITVVSVFLSFYFANIFIISSASKNSIIGQLSLESKKKLFKYNSKAISYAVLLLICYLFVNKHIIIYFVFVFLILSNIASAIRIYVFMHMSAKIELSRNLNK